MTASDMLRIQQRDLDKKRNHQEALNKRRANRDKKARIKTSKQIDQEIKKRS
ncbi:MAG: hypothetical protein WA395_07325 [Nitrososphaeraceae archaeon]